MRTSKKILSFFLAVVMVVTTCSVGFTAFAAEKNDSIWSTDCGADEAFATLNDLADELLPELLINNIGLVGDGVFQKYAKDYGKTYDKLTDKEKAEIVDKATLTDVLQALQPTLIGALAKESQSDYAIRVGGGHPKDPSYYDYLQRDGALDFYTLYALCDDNRANRDLSQSTRDTLTEWYNILKPIANVGLVDDSEELTKRLYSDYEDPFTSDSEYRYANLYSLKSFYTEEYMNANTTAEERSMLEALYAEKNSELEIYNTNYKITDFAEYTYYSYNGSEIKYISAYYNLINLSGAKISYSSDEDLLGFNDGEPLSSVVTIPETLTLDNYRENIAIYYFSEVFDLGNPQSLTLSKIAEIFADDGEGNIDQELIPYFEDLILSSVDTAMLNKILPSYEQDIVNGLAIEYSDQVNSMEDLTKLVEAQLPADYLDSTKLFDDSLTKTPNTRPLSG